MLEKTQKKLKKADKRLQQVGTVKKGPKKLKKRLKIGERLKKSCKTGQKEKQNDPTLHCGQQEQGPSDEFVGPDVPISVEVKDPEEPRGDQTGELSWDKSL